MKFFGEKIRELREQQKLPLRKVAAFLDIDTSILSKVERGERSINKQQIEKLALFFDEDPKALYQEYLGEQIAKSVYQEADLDSILKVAEDKANYLKSKSAKQSKITFDGTR